MTAILAIRLVSLFVFLWFGYILGVDLINRNNTHWLNIAVPSAAAVAFAWSMGWLA